MATVGPNIAGTGATVDRAGSTAWGTPTNIQANDGSYTSAAVPTDYLVCSNFNLNVPPGAVILGVSVALEGYETGSGSSSYIIQLISNTTPTLIGASKGPTTVTGGTSGAPNSYTEGSASDLWSAALTAAIVNASGFGVAVWSTDTTNTLFFDFVSITVTYWAPALFVGPPLQPPNRMP